MGDAKKSDINWMYEGEKSKLDEEAYLTGRKIDRHFDRRHADGDSSKIESLVRRKASDHQERKISVLDLETVKKEDPLVAIKVREQEIRREIFDNPLKMKRLKKIVVAAMRKKLRKMMKKGEIPDFLFENLTTTKIKQEPVSEDSDSSSSPETSKRRIRHDSESSEDERKKPKSFGLVYVNSKPKQEPLSERRDEKPNVSRKPETPSSSHRPRQKLSEKEMEEKRREMMQNARWRDEQKNRKRRKYEEDEEKERREEKGKSSGAQFLKPMISRAMDDRTVEERIRSKKQHLQRHGSSMETNFAKK